MQIIASTGREDIAMVYIGEFENNERIELVESIQPPIPRDKKWVLMISTLYGCPVQCKMCDAGEHYKGKLTESQLLEQIDFLIKQRYPDQKIPVEQLKIQFARIGEPTFNPNVLSVLEKLPKIYNAPGLMPSISTIAPKNATQFLEKLMEIKNKYYSNGQFQLQFSIHTTDEKLRDEMIPVSKWNFKAIAEFGKRFFKSGDRKITLNFALAKGIPIDSNVLKKYFDPSLFLIKITPLNPTYRAKENKLESYIGSTADETDPIVVSLKAAGYEVIVSIGALEENQIGSNCGQYVKRHLQSEEKQLNNAYTYPLQDQK
ncbi:MAG: radical SAM protein [Candidatus Hodarchaeales archaeon]|jgi:23S rRNA (adenine2503-C2)-methyltransferase